MKCSKAIISTLLAFSFLLTSGCNVTIQLGGKDNKSEQKNQTLSQTEPEVSTPATQSTPQESASPTISELEERTRLAEEQARLAEERAKIAEEQLKSQKVEPELDPDTDVGNSEDTEQAQHLPKRRTPRQSYQPEYYNPSLSYSQPQQQYSPPQQYTPPPQISVPQPQPPRSSVPVVVYNFPQPSSPQSPVSNNSRQVYRSDGQTQESPPRGHSTRKKILIGAGIAGAATLGYIFGRRH